MNETPLMTPEGQSCPNCGHTVAATAKHCPNCGATLAGAASGSTSSAAQVWRIILLIGLAGLALLFGAAGACVMLIGVMGGGGLTTESLTYAGIGILLLIFAALCLWGVLSVSKRR